MALTRVQATPRGSNAADINVYFTFAALPTIGNAIVVVVNTTSTNGLTCSDNQGNAYTLATQQTNGSQAISVFVCAKVTAASGTVTVNVHCASFCNFTGNAIEVSGVGTGLSVDQTAGAGGNSLAPATGATAALTGSESFQVAGFASGASQSSITVAAATPTWNEEWEGNVVAGEADARVVTSADGTTPSASWTPAASGFWVAVVAAFKAGGVAAVPRTVPFVILPV